MASSPVARVHPVLRTRASVAGVSLSDYAPRNSSDPPSVRPWRRCHAGRAHARGCGLGGDRCGGACWARPALTILVVDTSPVLKVIAAVDPAPGLSERLTGDGDLHAPHLIDIEVLRAAAPERGWETERGSRFDARADFRDLAVVRDP
jgi:hypothetical protein